MSLTCSFYNKAKKKKPNRPSSKGVRGGKRKKKLPLRIVNGKGKRAREPLVGKKGTQLPRMTAYYWGKGVKKGREKNQLIPTPKEKKLAGVVRDTWTPSRGPGVETLWCRTEKRKGRRPDFEKGRIPSKLPDLKWG